MATTQITARDGGRFAAYVAVPKQSGRHPGLVLLQEIFGVNKSMRGIADGFAAQGYIVYCPDMFWRQQPGVAFDGNNELERVQALALYSGFNEDRGVDDVAATIAALRADPRCNGTVAALGYCLGGKLAYLAAARTDVDAAVSYYGVGIEKALGEAGHVAKPLMLHVPTLDPWCPPVAQSQIHAALDAHPEIKVHDYVGANHAFARKSGQHYDKAAADLADRRSREFLNLHVGGKPMSTSKSKSASKKSAPQTLRAHRFVFDQPGGPEVLKWVEVELPPPDANQVRVRQTAIGLNYIDTYHRSGLYKMPLPSPIGLEAAGIVEAIGKGVKGLKLGDRVATGFGAIGGYATHRLIAADKLVKIPAGIKDETAAAMMLKGMTAEYLLHRTYKVKKGETILVHAAAGGVGLILCQWAKALGVTVIGTVSSDEKAKIAKAHGCKYPIVTSRENFVERVKQITKGKGVPVVYDSVGKDTFQGTMECLAPRGYFVSFGNASGPVPPFDPALLAPKSLYYSRASLGNYVATRAELELSTSRLFSAVKSGKVKIRVNQRYALKDAAQAHRDLEGRKTTGSTVFQP